MTETPVIVVDLKRLLDESKRGQVAAQELQARFDAARVSFERLSAKGTSSQGRQQAAEVAAEFERDALRQLEEERARLRTALLDAARPLLASVMKERRAQVVLDARACLVVDDAIDITNELLRRLDETDPAEGGAGLHVVQAHRAVNDGGVGRSPGEHKAVQAKEREVRQVKAEAGHAIEKAGRGRQQR
jgi:Skp family chaperone for outer membrane proteins